MVINMDKCQMRAGEDMCFHKITLDDQEWMKQKHAEDNRNSCEYSFANNFIWSSAYGGETACICGCGIIRYHRHESCEYIYSFPFGDGDKKAAIEKVMEICKRDNQKAKFYPVLENDKENLIKWFPHQFMIESDRGDFDYVYTVEKLSTLKGRKLHGKRNHIARFKDESDWSYEALDSSNKEECRDMAKRWTQMREEKWNSEMDHEMSALEAAITHFGKLGLKGGVLRKSGEIVAFTIGERLNHDTMVVHFEKAYPKLQGAYPMINQQFVLNECQDYTYVNREEDTGDLSLRKAKLSYYPDYLVTKYSAHESEIVYANRYDKEQIVNIWQACFGDDKDYINMYLENRFTDENMLVIYEDGKIVSMASFLPTKCIVKNADSVNNGFDDENMIDVRYVYAVATLPEYQNKGYAKRLIRYAMQKYGEPLLLQPAEETLEKFYEEMGFRDVFIRNDVAYTLDELEKMYIGSQTETSEEYLLNEVGAVKYKQIRDRLCSKETYIAWDENAIQYALDENEFCGGKACANKQENVLVLYRVEGESLHVVEFLTDEVSVEDKEQILRLLMKNTNTHNVYMKNSGGMVYLPENKAVTYEDMINGYLNLTLG